MWETTLLSDNTATVRTPPSHSQDAIHRLCISICYTAFPNTCLFPVVIVCHVAWIDNMTQLVRHRSSPALRCGGQRHERQANTLNRKDVIQPLQSFSLCEKNNNKVEKHSFGLYFKSDLHFSGFFFFLLPGYSSSLILEKIRCNCAEHLLTR